MFRSNQELHQNEEISNENYDTITNISHGRSIRRPYETRSLVFRSMEDNCQQHSFMYMENHMNNISLFDCCRTQNWDDARKRAISYPREAFKYMDGTSKKPTSLLLACARVSKFEKAYQMSLEKVAPLETVQAITKACPKQLRYPTALEMFSGATPLHEAIMNPSIPLDVIKFLILADDFWNNQYNEKNPDMYPVISKGKYSESNKQPFFFQKSSCRIDSMGCTPLHVWVNRIFGFESYRFLFEKDDDNDDIDENIMENDRNPGKNHKIPRTSNIEDTKMKDLDCHSKENTIFNHEENIFFNNSEYMLFNNEEDIFTITKLLIHSNSEAIGLKDKSGRSPLVIVLQWMCSLRGPQPQNELINKMGVRMTRIVQIMVKACPSAINVQCSTFGCSALHHAIMYRRSLKIIEYLIEASPKATMIRNITGELPLHIASSMAAPLNILELILNAGLEALTTEDRGGRTALHWIWIRYIESTESSYNDDNTINPFPQNMSPLKRYQRRRVPYNWNELQSSWFSKLYANICNEGFRESFMNCQFWKTTELLLKAAHFISGKNQNFHLLHVAATTSCPRAIIFVALALYPDEVKVKDDQNRLLIHIAASRPFNRRWSLDKFDNYFMQDCQNEHPHATITSINGNCQQILNSSVYGIQKTENAHCPLIDTLLRMYPMSAKITDDNNRLPLHIAIDFEKDERQSAKKIIGRVESFIRFSPYLLSTRDGTLNGMLSPFMLAGCGDNADFNMSYELLCAAPEAVNNAIFTS